MVIWYSRPRKKMIKEDFKKYYLNYKSKEYPVGALQSVKRCYLPFDKRQPACERAAKEIKVSVSKAIEDVHDFFNCVRLCYSGYEYFLTDKKTAEIEDKLVKKLKHRLCRTITNGKLADMLALPLKNILCDSHFCIYAYHNEHHFIKKTYAYVSDLVLKKLKDSYKVVKGNDVFFPDEILEEDDVDGILFPTLYVGEGADINEEYFLVGLYSQSKVEFVQIAGKKIPVHLILSDKACQTDGVRDVRIIDKGNYVIVNHNSYSMPWNMELLDTYEKEGCACAKKSAVILNLTGNSGGCSDYPMHFYKGLSCITENGFEGEYLPMPDELTDSVKRYTYSSIEDQTDRNSYKGRLFVVMNKATASSAEMGVSPAYYIKDALLVGSATYGCGTFGECMAYQLSNSGINFVMGHKLFNHDKFEEGEGFLPDYWIDSVEPVSVIEKYLELLEKTY